IAFRKARSEFSGTPLAMSCRPRCATGVFVSHFGSSCLLMESSAYQKYAIGLEGNVEGQGGCGGRTSRGTHCDPEQLGQQISGSVSNLVSIETFRDGIHQA